MNINRMKLIYIYLKKHSSRDTKVIITDIMNYLNNEEIRVSRNTIKNDIDLLVSLGLPIKYDIVKSGAKGYYIESYFTYREAYILLDLIGSNKFLPVKEYDILRQKILNFFADKEKNKFGGNIKTKLIDTGEVNVLHNIEILHCGINNRKYISFCILKRNADKSFSEKDYKKAVIPSTIYYYNDRYYLIAFYKNGSMRNFRVDRMKDIKLGECHNKNISFDLSNYHIENFDMFGSGEVKRVEFLVRDFLLDSVIEKFGDAASIYEYPENKNYFRFTANVKLNKGILRWILKQGKDIIIINPSELIEMLKKEIDEIKKNYMDIF